MSHLVLVRYRTYCAVFRGPFEHFMFSCFQALNMFLVIFIDPCLWDALIRQRKVNPLGLILDNFKQQNVDNILMILVLRWSAILNYELIVLVQDENKIICVRMWRGFWRTATTENGLSHLFVVSISLPQRQDHTPMNCFISIAGSKCQPSTRIIFCLIRNDCTEPQ